MKLDTMTLVLIGGGLGLALWAIARKGEAVGEPSVFEGQPEPEPEPEPEPGGELLIGGRRN